MGRPRTGLSDVENPDRLVAARARRFASVEEVDMTPHGDNDRVVLYRAFTPSEAELVRLILHSAGISAVRSSADQHPDADVMNDVLPASLDGGRDVYVEACELDRARETLRGSSRILSPAALARAPA